MGMLGKSTSIRNPKESVAKFQTITQFMMDSLIMGKRMVTDGRSKRMETTSLATSEMGRGMAQVFSIL